MIERDAGTHLIGTATIAQCRSLHVGETWSNGMRYYMHPEDSVRFFDPQGQELPDDAAAVSAAKQLAKHISQHPINEGLSQIRVTDSSGRIVATVPIP
jgi:hypothetical protein